VKVLVVEDDRLVAQFLQRGLEEQGMQVELVGDGRAALEAGADPTLDLIILAMRRPGLAGPEVLRTLRDRGIATPVLVLTAQDAVESKVQALRTGADDYVTKPFAFDELLARVEALSRRPKAIAPQVLTVGDLQVDTGSREVRRAGTVVEMTPKEFAVLVYLVRNQGRVMSRTLITEYAWGYHFDPGTNVVDVVINRLRKKIDQGFGRRLIHTVRGVGYVMKP
jgi:two-component system copper resistance phosphate regulon response regulator CusR